MPYLLRQGFLLLRKYYNIKRGIIDQCLLSLKSGQYHLFTGQRYRKYRGLEPSHC